MPADFTLFLWELFTSEHLITILFTMLVIGGTCMALSVLPRWQDEEALAARKEEAARVAKPTPVEELRKAA